MDIEELNKTQIILLTLLISFVTSIATGIVTVSLMNQAPKIVTDTVHRVIEKTVERVVPGEQKATIIENTKTIIISDQDFIINAIENNSESLVRVFTTIEIKDEQGTITQVNKFVGLGIIISAEGKIIMNSFDLPKVSEPTNYFITVKKTKIKLSVLEKLPNNEITVLLAQPSETESKPIFKPVKLGDSSTLKLGQSVISLGGKESNVVLTGIVSNLKTGELPMVVATSTGQTAADKPKIIILEIETNLGSQLPMGILIDLDGEIIGVRSQSSFYIPINLIKPDLDKLNKVVAEVLQPPTGI